MKKNFLKTLGLIGGITAALLSWFFIGDRNATRLSSDAQDTVLRDSLPLRVVCIDEKTQTEIDLGRYQGAEILFKAESESPGFAILLSINSGGTYSPRSEIGELSGSSPPRSLVFRAPFSPTPARPADLSSGGVNNFAVLGAKNRASLQALLAAHERSGLSRDFLKKAGATFPFAIE